MRSSGLDAVLVSKDAVKEALATVLPDAVAIPSLGAIAMQAAWDLTAQLPGLVVLESFWFRPRDLGFVDAELRSSRPAAVVEVWCDVSADVARNRYATRVRPSLHDDARRLAEDWDDWAARAGPLALTPVIKVDTSQQVDIAPLIRAVRPVLPAVR